MTGTPRHPLLHRGAGPAGGRPGVDRAGVPLRGSAGESFVAGIAGADACSPRHCDLSRGIEVHGDAMTFPSPSPIPSSCQKLAYGFGAVLPSGTPVRPPPTTVPATGPYRVAAYRRNRRLVLERNPHCREWSRAAQPAAEAGAARGSSTSGACATRARLGGRCGATDAERIASANALRMLRYRFA